jgi:hypothetical protein
MATAIEVIQTVMSEVQGLAKTDRNQAQGFNFRGIDAVMNAVGPALRKAGGFVVPSVVDKSSEVQPSRNGGSLQVVRLTVAFTIVGSEGDPITGTVAAEAFDSGDKATAKAMSVAFRTFLLQVLCLPTDEPDPDASSYELGKVGQDELHAIWKSVIAAKTVDELKAIWDANTAYAQAEFQDDFGANTLAKAIAHKKEQLTRPADLEVQTKLSKPATKAVAK